MHRLKTELGFVKIAKHKQTI